ncbi:MAG: sigma 54-interacting transcriptional regulator [Acidobacteriota bacterium]
MADTGSFFLDEIGDMELGLQPKLLKVIEDQEIRRVGSVQGRQVDVRVLAASHFDLETLIREGRFRQDLYYRLNVLHVAMPALRERREDIADLARGFLARSGRGEVRGFSDEALAWLETYEFPGNIRELRNLVERATVHARGGLIRPEHFGGRLGVKTSPRPVSPALEAAPNPAAPMPAATSEPSVPVVEPPAPVDRSLAEMERRHVLAVLEDENGNKTRAAKVLGITRQTLLRKLRGWQADEGEDADVEVEES